MKSKIGRYARWILLCLVTLVVACAGNKQLGDRSFAAGQYQTALDYYEEEIEAGSRDVQVFFKAAVAATHLGSFASAERYYSQALRYGGGVEVARSLGQFYIQTSNYARAVRVYQYLLKYEADPQPLYNNLGTALMYAGLPFDAEAYLLIAQQMDPGDPVPYINLGLLYDRHLKQPVLAAGFYGCYVSMSNDRGQIRIVETRLEEMRVRGGDVSRAGLVQCGRAYQPEFRPVGNLKALFQGAEWQDNGDDPAASGDDRNDPELLRPEGDTETPGKLIIERQIVDRPGDSNLTRREIARAAFEKGEFSEASRVLSSLPVDELTPADMRMLGMSLGKDGRTGEAIPWLEWSLKRDAQLDTLDALLDIYEREGMTQAATKICSSHGEMYRVAGQVNRCATSE